MGKHRAARPDHAAKLKRSAGVALGALALGASGAMASAGSASAAEATPTGTADFNHDGRDDLVAGTPYVTADGATTAGSVKVLPGAAGGPATTGIRTLTQNSPGVPGSSEGGDHFGAATAWGDVNGDGYADLIVGAPGENSVKTDRGAVTVMLGPNLNTGSWYTIGDSHPATGAEFGSAVTAGDFNGDGQDDVFAAGEGVGANGLWWARDSASESELAGDLSSAAVSHLSAASGDFDHDGYDDVVVSFLDAGGIGRLALFKGSADGLDGIYSVSTAGGRSIAAGDLNGDGYDDIVVGQAYTAESGAHSGGQITAVYGSPTGLGTMRTTLNQSSTGVAGASEAGDALGTSVAVGDFNADGYADVLAGAPAEDITRSGTNRKDAGAAWLFKGSAGGISGSGSLDFNQDSTDISGATETGDRFGSQVVLGDFAGAGRASLAIGVEGEDSGNGTVLQLDSTSTGGVSNAGGFYYGRTQLGTPAGAKIGSVLDR